MQKLSFQGQQSKIIDDSSQNDSEGPKQSYLLSHYRSLRKSSLQLESSVQIEEFNGLKQPSSAMLTPQKQQQTSNLTKSSNFSKKRKASFIQFENTKQSIIEKIIRQDSPAYWNQDNIPEEQQQTIICMSDIYTNVEGNWTNRKIKNLTSNHIADIPVQQIAKIKIKSAKPMQGYLELKLTTKKGNLHDLAVRQSCAAQWFSAAIWVCLVNMGMESPLMKQKVLRKQGEILKKSQIIGKWQPRYVKIDNINGLTSSKIGQQKPSLKVQETTQLWTRLQRYENDTYLIIKLWNLMFKQQFCIPIKQCSAWLRAFCLLILRK